MKKLFSICLCVVLLCLFASAFASTGDRNIVQNREGNYSGSGVSQVCLIGRKVYVFLEGMTSSLLVTDLDTSESRDYSLQELYDSMNGVSSDSSSEEEVLSEQVALWFSRNDDLYAVVVRCVDRADGSREVRDAAVRRLSLEGDKAELLDTDIPVLDWEPMTESYGSWQNTRWANSKVCFGDTLYISTYDDSGNSCLMVYDLTTGQAEERYIRDLNAIGSYGGDRLLITQTRWDENASTTVSLYDTETEDTEILARFDITKENPRGIAYQEATNTLYYVMNGEIYAAPDCDTANAQAVNDCMLSSSEFGQITEDGLLLLYDYSTVVLRNTDPAQRSETVLHVRPYTWSQGTNSAYYAFTEKYGDTTVVIEDYGDESNLLQAMMNRDDRVDVYLMAMSSSVYSAIYDRGFMADLSGSALLVEKTDAMYDAFRECLTRNGKLVAIPVNVYGDGVGYDREVLKGLGMTEADLPRTWDQFFDMLESLPGKLEGTAYRTFEAYCTQEEFRSGIVSQILSQYSMAQEDQPYNTEQIRSLLDRMNRLDFDALGLMTNEEQEEWMNRGDYDGGEYKQALISTYTEFALMDYSSNTRPLLLSFAEGEDAVLPVELSVAWVNPYSRYQEKAVAFLECMASTVGKGTQYTVSPEQNEPQRYPDHEETRKNMEKYAEEARKNLAKAEDEEDKAQWTEIVEQYEKSLAEFEDTYWMISPSAIEDYHARAGSLRPARWNLYSEMYRGTDSEAFSMIYEGFLQGQKTAEELLSYIDRKVQMMRLEGN